MRMVLTSGDLSIQLTLPRTLFTEFSPHNLPEVTRLILVASGIVSGDGKGRTLAKDDLTPETLKLIINEN